MVLMRELSKLKMKTVSIVLPTLNEAENIPVISGELRHHIEEAGYNWEIIFVDDNSQDGSMEIFQQLHNEDQRIKCIVMSRRFGDQLCLMAGLEASTGDAVITMDSDLQHPPSCVPSMIEAWEEGAEIVIMIRRTAGHKSLFKKITEVLFYKILSLLSDSPIIHRFAGFALMDRRAVNAVQEHREFEPFLRGLIPLVGFRRQEMLYDEDPRRFGDTKYDFIKMWRLAISGLTSFSVKPLYFSIYFGGTVVVFAAGYALYLLLRYVFLDVVTEPGWASSVIITLFMGGTQLFCIGLLGIYISKVFLEVKRRPRFTVSEQAIVESRKSDLPVVHDGEESRVEEKQPN